MNNYIVGWGNHSKIVYQIASENKIKIDGFLHVPFNKEKRFPKKIKGLSVKNYTKVKKKSNLYIGVGNIKERIKIFESLKKKFSFPTLISRNSLIDKSVIIKQSSLIMPNVVINIDSKIGRNVIINTGSIIEHDVIIGDNVIISPGSIICGGSVIEKNSYIGAGSVIQQNIRIGKNCLVGSGSNVIKDIKKNSVSYGNPATIK